jgi:GNAT superfamily N-acetyltransferase
VANSLHGDQADQVLVLEREGEVLGFISLKLPPGGEGPDADTGWVALNAISPSARGRGLYHGLLQRGLAWLAKHRAARARVRTKLTQEAVIRAWSVAGGRQVYADLTFHLWADQAPGAGR